MNLVYIAAVVVSLTGSMAFADSLEQQMANELKPHVKTITREFSVFHYFNRAAAKAPGKTPLKNDDLKVRAHLAGMADVFLKPQKSRPDDRDSDDAYGLYAANDPFISQKFGDTLVMMPVHAGHVTLEEPANFRWSKETEQALLAKQCKPYDGIDLDFRYVLLSVANENCRAVAVEVLKLLNVDSIAYHYGSFPPTGCDENQDLAFVYLGTKGLSLNDVKVFGDKIPAKDENASDRQAISGLIRINPINGMQFGDMWPDLKIPASVDLKVWQTKNLLACQSGS